MRGKLFTQLRFFFGSLLEIGKQYFVREIHERIDDEKVSRNDVLSPFRNYLFICFIVVISTNRAVILQRSSKQ